MSVPQVSIPQVSTTAKDLIPSTESKDPESPILGDGLDFLGIAKKKGKESLKITNDTIPTNTSPIISPTKVGSTTYNL